MTPNGGRGEKGSRLSLSGRVQGGKVEGESRRGMGHGQVLTCTTIALALKIKKQKKHNNLPWHCYPELGVFHPWVLRAGLDGALGSLSWGSPQPLEGWWKQMILKVRSTRSHSVGL